MNIGDIFVTLRADDKTLQRDAQKAGENAGTTAGGFFRQKFSKSMEQLRSNGGLFGALTQGVGIGAGLGIFNLMSIGIGAVTDALSDSIAKAQEEQAGIERLNASLKANVEGWDGNRDAIEAVIAQREKLAFSDGEQRDSLAKIVASTHDVSKALDIQRTAMDLARLRGISLADAGDLLTKVYNGNVGILKRYGIQVRTGASATEALAAVQKQAAGQAEAYGKTTKGRIESVQIAIEDFQEVVGGALIDAGKAAIDTLFALGEAFHNLQRFMDPLGATLEDTDKALAALATSQGLDPDVVLAYVDATRRATQAQDDFNKQQAEIRRVGMANLSFVGDLTDAQEAQLQAWIKSADGIAIINDALGEMTAAVQTNLTEQEQAAKTLSQYLSVADLAQRTSLSFDQMMDQIDQRMLSLGLTWEQALGKVGTDIRQGVFIPMGRDAALAMIDSFVQQWLPSGPAVKAVTGAIASPFKEAAKLITDTEPFVTVTLDHIKNKSGKGWHWKKDISTQLTALKHQFRDDTGRIQQLLLHPTAEHTETWLEKKLKQTKKLQREAAAAHNWQAFEAAEQTIKDLNAELDSIDGRKVKVQLDMYSYQHGFDWGAFGLTPPHRAAGGPVQRGMPYVVGERRPEVFVPETNGRIIPSTSASRVDFYVHDVNGGLARAGISTRQLADQLRRWEDG